MASSIIPIPVTGGLEQNGPTRTAPGWNPIQREVGSVNITAFDLAQRFVGVRELPGDKDNHS